MTRILLVIYSILELSGLGGWSTQNTKPVSPDPAIRVSERGSYAYGVHVGYALQFHRNVGIGIGVDLARYGSSTLITGDKIWNGVTDTDGESYNHRLHLYSLTDQMQQVYVNVPVALRFIIPMGRTAIEAQVGAKVGLPLSSTASYKGDVEHYGMYPQWGDMELSQVPNHGFYRDNTIQGTYALNKRLQAFAFAKIGVIVPLTYRLQLSAHVGVDYGLLTNTADQGNTELGCNNGNAAHSFMPKYNGILATNITKGNTHPMSVTGEIGLRLVLEHTKNYPCRCYMW